MSNCIFCKILTGEFTTDFIYEDEYIVAFNDLYPKATVHVLVVPKKHIESLDHLSLEDQKLMGHLTVTLPKIARLCGLDNGFRTIVNTGPGGKQEVPHIHYHILGGEFPKSM